MRTNDQQLPQQEPATDLEFVVGYAQIRAVIPVMSPALAEFTDAFLAAYRRPCAEDPEIASEVHARATLQAHKHFVGSPSRQKRGALIYMKDQGLMVLSSQYTNAR